jgi:hypothetical protein
MGTIPVVPSRKGTKQPVGGVVRNSIAFQRSPVANGNGVVEAVEQQPHCGRQMMLQLGQHGVFGRAPST